jgi:lipopolysaccharide export system protein LptA
VIRRRASILAGLSLAVAIAATSSAHAQPQPSGPPNAMQGFSQNRDKPVKIDANSLEVRDKDKIATFSGNVHVVQGDTTLRCKVLVVYYDQEAGTTKTPSAGVGGNQQIRKMEAKGNVIVTQKDQTATGDSAVYEMQSNSVTLIGNVVVTQGPNVLKGEKMYVDLTSGVSRIIGPVQGMITPSSAPKPDKAEKGEGKTQARDVRDAAKPRGAHP